MAVSCLSKKNYDHKKTLKKEHSEMLFPEFLVPKNQFPREGWSSLKLSL